MPAQAMRCTALLSLLSVLGCPKQAAPEPPNAPEISAEPASAGPAETPARDTTKEPSVESEPVETDELEVANSGHTVRFDREQLEALRTKLLARIEQSELPADERSELAKKTRERPIHIFQTSALIAGFRLDAGDEQLTLDMRAHTGPNMLMGYRAEVTRKGSAWEVGPVSRYTAHRARR